MLLFVTSLLINCSLQSNKNTINPILGDISSSSFSSLEDMDENARIKKHLLYVENLLRSKETDNATIAKLRNKVLDLLHNYASNGIFPKNYDYPDERKPCFIDKDGNICAVGYLVEQTAGRNAAEYINSKFKYEELMAMNDPILDHWVENSGFSKSEIAMIQPTYGGPAPSNKIEPLYGVSSAILGGTSFALNLVNLQQTNNKPTSKFVPLLGLFAGASQLTMGIENYPKNVDSWGTTYTNNSQRDLSLVNIGLGTTTLFLSSLNLISNREPKEKKVSWNAFSYPTQDRQMTFGLSFSKRF